MSVEVDLSAGGEYACPDSRLRVLRAAAVRFDYHWGQVMADLLSQTTEYALRAVVVLAGNGATSRTARELTEETGVPAPYLQKVLRTLVSAGILASRRGPTGGFVLRRPAETLTVLDVVNAVEPLERITVCPLGRPHHVELCPLHRCLDAATGSLMESLARMTIAELNQDQASRPLCPDGE